MASTIRLSSWRDWSEAFGQQVALPGGSGHSGHPMVIGPVYAYRGYGGSDENGVLQSWDEHLWVPGWNRSRCGNGNDHEPPAEGCSCGFYGVKTIPNDRISGSSPLARIELAGVVVEHDAGYRAQAARIDRMLYVSSDAQANQSDWRRLAQHYGADRVWVWDCARREFDWDAAKAILDQ